MIKFPADIPILAFVMPSGKFGTGLLQFSAGPPLLVAGTSYTLEFERMEPALSVPPRVRSALDQEETGHFDTTGDFKYEISVCSCLQNYPVWDDTQPQVLSLVLKVLAPCRKTLRM